MRNVEELRAHVRDHGPPKWLFFWGHDPAGGGRVTKSCLSQWWASPFEIQGIRFATAEHYMMAEKARLFGDLPVEEKILQATHPGAAKALGREVRGFDQERWDAARWDIVVRGNLAKFSQHAELLEFLLGTGERVLVEASPQDRVWGIGLVEGDRNATNPDAWRGLNLLGFALMEVRERLRRG